MTPDSLILRAFNLCCLAHENQWDRDGLPHAFHCVRIAEQQATPERIAIALLHDALEDKPDMILELPDECLHAVNALTKDPRESYPRYIARVCTNEDAMWVKLADLTDNLRPERMDAKAARKAPLYLEAYAMICKKLGI